MYIVCECVLYYCHRMSTQLQLNISYQYNNLPKETMVSANTLLRTEPELSNNSVLII